MTLQLCSRLNNTVSIVILQISVQQKYDFFPPLLEFIFKLISSDLYIKATSTDMTGDTHLTGCVNYHRD